MAVDKTLLLDHGGTVIVTLNGVNLFDANEEERQLLTDLTDAIKKYERRREAKIPKPATAPADGVDG